MRHMTYLTGKLARLTEELFGATQRDALAWKAGTADHSYCTHIRDMEIQIEKIVGADGLPGIAITLGNRDGKPVQRFTDHDLVDHVPESEEHRNFWDMLTELHEMARWSAEGVFQVIDDLMAGLVPEEPLLTVEPPPGDVFEYGWVNSRATSRMGAAALR